MRRRRIATTFHSPTHSTKATRIAEFPSLYQGKQVTGNKVTVGVSDRLDMQILFRTLSTVSRSRTILSDLVAAHKSIPSTPVDTPY
jgi:hypothetical protein